MDPELLYGLVIFLGEGRIPSAVKEEIKQKIHKTSKNYKINKNNNLETAESVPRIIPPRHRMKAILQETHNTPSSGHQGRDATIRKTSEVYFWPNMREDIRQFVQACQVCQKRDRKKGETELQPIKKFPKPFYQVGMDVMGPLPITKSGKRYIVMAVDHFTKWVEIRALESNDAQSIASFFYEDVICRHGVPEILTTDQGTEFINEFMAILTRSYHIHHIKTTAYHPQGNGQVERTNKTIKDILAKCTPRNGDWSHYVHAAAYAVRVTKSASTNYSPAELLTGRKFRQPFDSRNQTAPEEPLDVESLADQEFDRISSIRTKAEGFIKNAQARQKRSHDQSNLILQPLKIGDPVLLYRSMIETSWSAKLEPKWEGPYYVQSIKGTTHRLRRTNGSILPKTFHRNRLKLYHGPLKPKYFPVVQVPVRSRPQDV
jgi:IS30 family transposase